MEITQDLLNSEREFFENKIASSIFYKNTPEEAHHKIEISMLRGVYLRTGIFTEDDISQSFKTVENRISRMQKGAKQ